MRLASSFLPRLILGAVLLAPRAVAAPACNTEGSGTPRERAKLHFQAGIRAYDAKRYSDAVDQLSCANQLLPDPAFSYNIAITYEAMRDAPTALRWYREHLRQGGADADTHAVRAKVAALEAQLQARGVQQLSVLSEPAGALLSIDDRAVGLTPLTLELNPGRHRYRLALAGHAAAEGTFELRADRSLDVHVELNAERVSPAVSPGVAGAALALPAPPAEPSPLARVGTWTWISLGASTLLLGGAAGFEIQRARVDGQLGSVSQVDFRERHAEMTAHQTTARVLAGLGGAALLGGGVLLISDLGTQPDGRDLAWGTCLVRGVCVSATGAF